MHDTCLLAVLPVTWQAESWSTHFLDKGVTAKALGNSEVMMPGIKLLEVKQPQTSRACVLSLGSVCHGACVLSAWTMSWAAPHYTVAFAAKLPTLRP